MMIRDSGLLYLGHHVYAFKKNTNNTAQPLWKTN